MGEMLGADPGALRGAANQLDQFERALTLTRARINGLVHTAPWQGEKAERFRQEWDSSYAGMLAKVAAGLADAKQQLEVNAEQQEWASQALSGGVMSTMPRAANQSASDLSRIEHRSGSLMQAGLGAFGLGAAALESRAKSDFHQAARDLHSVVNNHWFKDVVSWTGYAASAVSIVTPFLLPIPVVGEVALAASVSLNAAHLAGDSLEMAEGAKPVSIAALALDGAGTVFACTDLGGVTAISDPAAAAAAPGLRLTDDVSEAIPSMENSYRNTLLYAHDVTGVSMEVSRDLQIAKMVTGTADVASGAARVINDGLSGDLGTGSTDSVQMTLDAGTVMGV